MTGNASMRVTMTVARHRMGIVLPRKASSLKVPNFLHEIAKNDRGVLKSMRKVIDLRDGPRPSLASSLIDQLLPTIWLGIDMCVNKLISVADKSSERFGTFL